MMFIELCWIQHNLFCFLFWWYMHVTFQMCSGKGVFNRFVFICLVSTSDSLLFYMFHYLLQELYLKKNEFFSVNGDHFVTLSFIVLYRVHASHPDFY